jgi:hypothetical protein
VTAKTRPTVLVLRSRQNGKSERTRRRRRASSAPSAARIYGAASTAPLKRSYEDVRITAAYEGRHS